VFLSIASNSGKHQEAISVSLAKSKGSSERGCGYGDGWLYETKESILKK
jgi:hypothetical protein